MINLGDVRRAVVRRLPMQRRVQRHIEVPGLPRRRTRPGEVWAVTMVRNEADVIGHTVRHLLVQGVAGVIVVDNMSDDETPDVLEGLAAEFPGRVFPGRDTLHAYHQARKMSYLVNLARLAGAEWVIPFDADEFWFADRGTVAEYLAGADARVVAAQLYNCYPVSGELLDLGAADCVVRVAVDPSTQKVAVRPDRWVWVDTGNHSALDLGRAEADGLRIAHVPLRSFDQYDRKVVLGAAALDAAGDGRSGNHWRDPATTLTREERMAAWAGVVAGFEGVVRDSPARWGSWPA